MTYLTYSDRKIIERMLKGGESHRSIAKVLERGKSTISDEIRISVMEYETEYRADLAHQRSLRRQQNKGKKPKLKRNTILKEHVIRCLKEDQWSPEQIAGELNERCGMTIICHETIYQFIYSDEGKKLQLWLELRRKKRPIRQPYGKRKQRTTIPERVSIHERGDEANLRLEIGHLETDSVQFSNQLWILSVQIDRLTQKCVISKLPNKTALETRSALIDAVNELGEQHIKSITFDNGTENVKHVDVRDLYSIDTFFCDAYCSWQKGSVENINGLIRQYFPRWTDMNKVTDEQIYEVQEKLNNRPRKSLRYLTPNHAFNILAQGGRLYT